MDRIDINILEDIRVFAEEQFEQHYDKQLHKILDITVNEDNATGELHIATRDGEEFNFTYYYHEGIFELR